MRSALARSNVAVDRSDEGERGSASVEAVVIIPFVFLLIFAIIQGVVVLQAGNVAQAAASTAYNSARLYDSTAADGIAAGNATAAQAGSIISDVTVSVTRTRTTVTVTVTGKGATLLPGYTTDIERTVSGPTERWVE